MANEQEKNDQKIIEGVEIEPVDFKSTVRTRLMTTLDLCAIVNSIFRPIFSDWEGSTLLPDPTNGQLVLSLYFKDKPAKEGMVRALTNVMKVDKGAPLLERMKNMNVRNQNRVFELSENAKYVLSKFLYYRPNNQKPNWSQMVTELSEPSYGAGGHQIYVKVYGLDIINILKAKFGNKSERGGYYDYQLNILKPISQIYSGDNCNYIISVLQLDSKEVEDLCTKIGMIPIQGNIPIVRN